MEYQKPLPLVNDLNRPHWEAARQRRFVVQHCEGCGHMWFPPLPNCNRCLSTDIEWVPVSGKGSWFTPPRRKRTTCARAWRNRTTSARRGQYASHSKKGSYVCVRATCAAR